MKHRFIYILPQYWKTITESQIIGWLEKDYQNGCPFSCISLVSDESKLIDKDKKKSIEVRIGGTYSEFVFGSGSFIARDRKIYAYLKQLLEKSNSDGVNIVFISRISYVGSVMKKLKKLFNFKYIYDERASYIIEYDYNNHSPKLKKFLKIKLKRMLVKKYETNCLKASDLIFSVSTKLINYAAREYKVDKAKFVLMPGAVDSEQFKFNNELRSKLRAKYNIEDKIVVVYAGKLARQWQKSETMFQLLSNLIEQDSRFMFLVLTPDLDISSNLKERYGIPDENLLAFSLAYDQVPSYLSIADCGLLLRDNLPINNTASPTKYCEYICNGLPVVTSKGVGDYSDFTKLNELGYVISDFESIEEETKSILQYICKVYNDMEQRRRIENIGRTNYSKEIFMNRRIATYKRLTNQTDKE